MAFSFGSIAKAVAGPLIGGAASALGSYYQAKQAQQSAKAQMKFQERMSNTSFQRGMKDLRAAGLNPILAAKVGGASTPQGAGYQTPNIGAAAVQGAHSAMATQNAYTQNKLLQKQATAAQIETDFLKAEPWAVPAKMLQGMSAGEIAAFKLWWETTHRSDAKTGAKAYGTKINKSPKANKAMQWEQIRYGNSRTGSKKKSGKLSSHENKQINDAWNKGDVYNATEWW